MKIKSLIIPVVLSFFISCKKTKTEPTPTPQSNLYLSTSAGSTWTYHQIDSSVATPANSNYTVTSTSKDTAINGKSYHIFNKSVGGNQYLNVTGHDYYQFDSLPAGFGAGVFERLYLKDDAAAGASWTQNQTVTISGFPIPVTLTFNIPEKGLTMVVNNITYTNVIHVSATITSSIIPSSGLSSNINSYYSEKVGLIKSSTKISLNYMGIIQTVNLFVQLNSSTIL